MDEQEIVLRVCVRGSSPRNSQRLFFAAGDARAVSSCSRVQIDGPLGDRVEAVGVEQRPLVVVAQDRHLAACITRSMHSRGLGP